MRSWIRSPIVQRIFPRSAAVIRDHGPASARRAAATAASTSSAPASATVVITLSSAGLIDSKLFPERAATKAPSMRRSPGGAAGASMPFSRSDPDARVEESLVFLVRVAVGHPRDVVGDRAVDPLEGHAPPRIVREQARVVEVAVGERQQDPSRLVLHPLDLLVVVEV